MINTELHNRAKELLYQWNRGGLKSTSFGLCSYLIEFGHDVQGIIKQWPGHSGNEDHPVPHPDYNPVEAYRRRDVKKYDLSTEYGRNRLSLLMYIIEQTRGE